MKHLLTAAKWLVAKALLFFATILNLAQEAHSYLKPIEIFANELLMTLLEAYGQNKIDKFKSIVHPETDKTFSPFTEDIEIRCN